MRQAHGGKRLRLAVLGLAIPAIGFCAIEGVVMNNTKSKPQPGATVTLIRLGSGMTSAGTVQSDAQGKFRLEQDLEAKSPHLLQVMHQGVTYNTMLPPGSASTGIELPVYDASANAPEAKVSQHMVLLEPTGTELRVSETFIYANSGKVTFNRPDGTLSFYIPPDLSTPLRVVVQAPQGMPVQRSAEKGKEPNTYVVKYPMRPGETRIDLSYALPAATKFASRILHSGGPVRIVVPKGVKLEGAGLSEMGIHQETQATIYELKGETLALNIEGTGSLRAAGGTRSSENSATEEDTSPGIEQAKPRIYKRLEIVIALSLAMLAIGFVLLYRSDLNRAGSGKRA
jgi:hypothetical protein